MPPEHADTSTSAALHHCEIGGAEYHWRVDNGQLVLHNASGDLLDPVAAQVIIALGGDVPAWYDVARALTAALEGAKEQNGTSIDDAAVALSYPPARRSEVARTTTDHAVLHALAAVGEAQVGRNPQCDIGAWDLILTQRDEAVRRKALSSNEVLPVSLWRHPDEATRVRVARNRECGPDVLYQLAHASPAVRAEVARNPSTPSSTLQQLATDHEWPVRRAVASNPMCPFDSFTRLLGDKYAEVRVAMVTNPIVPATIVRSRITMDPTPSVHAAIASRVDLRPPDLSRLERHARLDPLPQYRLVLQRITTNPVTPERLLLRARDALDRIAKMSPDDIREREAARAAPSPQVRRARLARGLIVTTVVTFGGLFATLAILEVLRHHPGAGAVLGVLSVACAASLVLMVHFWGMRIRRTAYRLVARASRGRIVVLALVGFAVVNGGLRNKNVTPNERLAVGLVLLAGLGGALAFALHQRLVRRQVLKRQAERH